jgi:hypothetical protein
MTDSTYHVLELLILGVPLWTGLLYFIVVLRLYPPHRHVGLNGKSVIEYPPHFSPGRTETLYNTKEG